MNKRLSFSLGKFFLTAYIQKEEHFYQQDLVEEEGGRESILSEMFLLFYHCRGFFPPLTYIKLNFQILLKRISILN